MEFPAYKTISVNMLRVHPYLFFFKYVDFCHSTLYRFGLSAFWCWIYEYEIMNHGKMSQYTGFIGVLYIYIYVCYNIKIYNYIILSIFRVLYMIYIKQIVSCSHNKQRRVGDLFDGTVHLICYESMTLRPKMIRYCRNGKATVPSVPRSNAWGLLERDQICLNDWLPSRFPTSLANELAFNDEGRFEAFEEASEMPTTRLACSSCEKVHWGERWVVKGLMTVTGANHWQTNHGLPWISPNKHNPWCVCRWPCEAQDKSNRILTKHDKTTHPDPEVGILLYFGEFVWEQARRRLGDKDCGGA